MKNSIQEIYALEQLASRNTCIHRLHPMVKLLSLAVYVVIIVSFDRYALDRLVPFVLYPALLMALSETPYSMLLKRFLFALPFCLFAGISNIIFDRAVAFEVGGMVVSRGVVSFVTILFRTYLCVMGVLILVSVTPLSKLTREMRRLKIPSIFIIMFEMTYRYIGVLLKEAHSMYTAYTLRSCGRRGIEMRDMGSFAGQLLLRSFDRADRVYSAMKCRGYAVQSVSPGSDRLKIKDIVFFMVILLFCLAFRFFDVNELYAGILGGFL